MAQSHNLELITSDQALVQAALDSSSRAIRELLGAWFIGLGSRY